LVLAIPGKPEGYVTCFLGTHMNKTYPFVCKGDFISLRHESDPSSCGYMVKLTPF